MLWQADINTVSGSLAWLQSDTCYCQGWYNLRGFYLDKDTSENDATDNCTALNFKAYLVIFLYIPNQFTVTISIYKHLSWAASKNTLNCLFGLVKCEFIAFILFFIMIDSFSLDEVEVVWFQSAKALSLVSLGRGGGDWTKNSPLKFLPPPTWE